MNRVTIAIILAVIAVIGIRVFDYFKTRHEILMAPVLKETEAEKVIINSKDNSVSVVKRNKQGQQRVKKQFAVRDVVTVLDNKGALTTTWRSKGFIREPGFVASYSDGLKVGADVQLFFWNRLGLNAGIVVSGSRGRVYIAASHVVPINLLSNTSVFVGIDHKSDVIFGLRVRL